MNVIAKFKCVEKREYQYCNEVQFEPTTEDRNFSEATPYGGLVLGGVKDEIANKFKVGTVYNISITE